MVSLVGALASSSVEGDPTEVLHGGCPGPSLASRNSSEEMRKSGNRQNLA